jgi:hypothetical protein
MYPVREITADAPAPLVAVPLKLDGDGQTRRTDGAMSCEEASMTLVKAVVEAN